MMRSIPLRGFDQQMSNMIVDYMEGKAVDADGNTVMIGLGIEVAAFLKSAGVSPDRVAVSGFGPNEPIVPNDSSEGRDRNRRVEIYVLDANGEQP